MRRSSIRSESRKPRRGYTLLEMLIVIGLILFMMTVLVMTIGNTIGSAKEQATRATLVKLNGLLQQRLDAFDTIFAKQLKSGQVSRQVDKLGPLLVNSGLPALKDGRASGVLEALVRKDYLRQAFPQTGNIPAGASPTSPVPGLGPDNRALVLAGAAFSGNSTTTPIQLAAESAEYLYYMLVESDSFGVSPVDAGQFSTSEVGDTDGDGRLEFLDAWGRPLRFYRWPTRIFFPDGYANPADQQIVRLMIGEIPPTLPSSGASDLLKFDPDLGPTTIFAIKQIEAKHREFQFLYHTFMSYHSPLIVSAGRDGKLGLLEPGQRPGLTASGDPPDYGYGYLAEPIVTKNTENLSDPTKVPYKTMIDWLSDNLTSLNVQTR